MLINDKFISKLILTFMHRGPPTRIICLDYGSKYSTIYKRIKLCAPDIDFSNLHVHMVISKVDSYN